QRLTPHGRTSISSQRLHPATYSGSMYGVQAQPELLPRVRGADAARSLREEGSPGHDGPLPAMRLAAGQRPVLAHDPWNRRRARGFLGGAIAALAMAGRRLELRPAPRRRHFLVHGDEAAHAGAGGVRPEARGPERGGGGP